MSLDILMNLTASTLFGAIAVWCVGRLGPMNTSTRKLDMVALVGMAASSLSIALALLYDERPGIEWIVLLALSLAWWLFAAPVSHKALRNRKRRA